MARNRMNQLVPQRTEGELLPPNFPGKGSIRSRGKMLGSSILPDYIISTPKNDRAVAFSEKCPIASNEPAFLHVCGNYIVATEAQYKGREKPRLACVAIPDITTAKCMAMLTDNIAIIGVKGAPGVIIAHLTGGSSEVLYFPLTDPKGMIGVKQDQLDCLMVSSNFTESPVCKTAAVIFKHSPRTIYLLEISGDFDGARVVAFIELGRDIITMCYTSDCRLACSIPNKTVRVSFSYNSCLKRYEMYAEEYNSSALENLTVVCMAGSPKYLICVSKCGKLIQFSHKAKSILRWVDLRNREMNVNSLTVSLSANVVALGCDNAVIRIFDIETLKYRTSLPHPPPRSAMAQRFIDGKARTIVDSEFADTRTVLFSKGISTSPDLLAVYSDGTLYMWCSMDLGKKALRPSMTLFSHSKRIIGAFPFPYNNQDAWNIGYGQQGNELFNFEGEKRPFNAATVSADGSIAFWQVTPDQQLSSGPELRGLVMNPKTMTDAKRTPVGYTCACSLADKNLLIVGDAQGYATVIDVQGDYTTQARIPISSLRVVTIDVCDTTVTPQLQASDEDASSASASTVSPRRPSIVSFAPTAVIAALIEDGRTILLSYSSVDNELRKLSFEIEPLYGSIPVANASPNRDISSEDEEDDEDEFGGTGSISENNDRTGNGGANLGDDGHSGAHLPPLKEKVWSGAPRPISLRIVSNGTTIIFLYSDMSIYRADIPPQKRTKEKLFEDSIKTMYLKLERLGKIDLDRYLGPDTVPVSLHKTTTFTQCAIGLRRAGTGTCDICVVGEGGIRSAVQKPSDGLDSSGESDSWGILRKYPTQKVRRLEKQSGGNAASRPPLVTSSLSPDCSHFCILDSHGRLGIFDFWSGLELQRLSGIVDASDYESEQDKADIYETPVVNMDMLGHCEIWKRGGAQGYIIVGSSDVVTFAKIDKFICEQAQARHTEIQEAKKARSIKANNSAPGEIIQQAPVTSTGDEKDADKCRKDNEDNDLSVNVVGKTEKDTEDNGKPTAEQQKPHGQETLLMEMCDDLQGKLRQAKGETSESQSSLEKTGNVIINPLSKIFGKDEKGEKGLGAGVCGGSGGDKRDEKDEKVETTVSGASGVTEYVEDFDDQEPNGSKALPAKAPTPQPSAPQVDSLSSSTFSLKDLDNGQPAGGPKSGKPESTEVPTACDKEADAEHVASGSGAHEVGGDHTSAGKRQGGENENDSDSESEGVELIADEQSLIELKEGEAPEEHLHIPDSPTVGCLPITSTGENRDTKADVEEAQHEHTIPLSPLPPPSGHGNQEQGEGDGGENSNISDGSYEEKKGNQPPSPSPVLPTQQDTPQGEQPEESTVTEISSSSSIEEDELSDQETAATAAASTETERMESVKSVELVAKAPANDSYGIDFYSTYGAKDTGEASTTELFSPSTEIMMFPETGETPYGVRKQPLMAGGRANTQGEGEEGDTAHVRGDQAGETERDKQVNDTSKITTEAAALKQVEKEEHDPPSSKPPLCKITNGHDEQQQPPDYPTPKMGQSKLKYNTKASEGSEQSISVSYPMEDIDPVAADIQSLEMSIRRLVSERTRVGISSSLRRRLQLLKSTIDKVLENEDEGFDKVSPDGNEFSTMNPVVSSTNSIDVSNMSNMSSEFIETFADIIADKITRRMGNRDKM